MNCICHGSPFIISMHCFMCILLWSGQGKKFKYMIYLYNESIMLSLFSIFKRINNWWRLSCSRYTCVYAYAFPSPFFRRPLPSLFLELLSLDYYDSCFYCVVCYWLLICSTNNEQQHKK